MREEKSIKLYFNIDGKETVKEAQVKKPSMAIRDKVLIELERYNEQILEINSRYPKTTELVDKSQRVRQEKPDITEEEIQNLVGAGLSSKELVEVNQESNKLTEELYRLECRLNLSIAKVILDTKQLLTAEKEVFNTDIESDFWMNTDIEEVEEAVKFFRTRNRI